MTGSTGIRSDWNAGLYDDKHAFVFKYGEDLVRLLAPQTGERILDVGCGTGYLTHLIAEAGAEVTGIDSAASMIEKAKTDYPAVEFKVGDITSFESARGFDAVFSNAVLHWVLNKEAAASRIYAALKKGGRLVLEMGGKDNVKSVVDALRNNLAKRGYAKGAALVLWYFPSVGEHTSLLESVGFRVLYAAHFSRETELKDRGTGITDWIRMFGQPFLSGIPEAEVAAICAEVQEELEPTHFRDGKWYADYKRLRIVAVKE